MAVTTPYSRNGPATYNDVNGTVQTAAINALRNQHYINGVLTFLYEPNPATNVVLWVEQYDNAAWTKRGTCVVTPNAVVAPDGNLTADQISGVALAGNDIFQAVGTLISGARYEPSFWLQRVSTVGTIQFTNPATTAVGDWRIDLSLLGAGWNWITRNHPAVTVVVEFSGHSTGVCGHFWRAMSGVALTFNLWHSQLELGTVSTSPIVPATTNVPITRAADLDPMLSAVAGGYSRQNGSFLTEGFVPGMSIGTTNFSFTPLSSVITKVSATSIAQSGQRIPESAVPGRSLTGTAVARGSGIFGTSQSTIDLSAFPENRDGVTNA